jgi:DNA integrity scanning protein DisA with diadenylate cyclase activity
MKGIISIIIKVNKYLTLVNKYYKHLNKLVKKNVLTEKEKYVLFNDKVKSFRPVAYPTFMDYKNNIRTYYKRE